ncbi:MAG: hypothetical protein Q9191_004829 [Dirinaria sp. TL-2023a]
MPQILEQQSLVEIKSEQHSVKPHFMPYFTQMTCMSLTEFSYYGLDNSNSEASGPKSRRLIGEAAAALKQGHALDYRIEVAIGAWHSPAVWDVTRAELSNLAYPSEAVQLASRDIAVTSHHEDTAVIRAALEHLIESEGKDVILVMHSYGGLAGTNAVSGLEKAARIAKGRQGGITHCLFIAAFLVPKGQSLLGMFPERPPYLIADPEDGNYVKVVDPKEVFYNDVSQAEAQPWIDLMRPQPASTFASTVDSVAWESGLLPCTYLMCEKDQGVYIWLQEKMLEGVADQSRRPWTIEKCNASHSAWLSETPTVVRLIRRCAGELLD